MDSFSSLTSSTFVARAAIVAAPIVTAGVLLYSKANRDWYRSLHHPCPRVPLAVHVVLWIVVAVVVAWVWNKLAGASMAVDLLIFLAVVLQVIAVYVLFGQKDHRLAGYLLVAVALLFVAAAALVWGTAWRNHAYVLGVIALVYGFEAVMLHRTYA